MEMFAKTMLPIVQPIIMIGLLISVGYILRKKRVVDATSLKPLSEILLNIALPMTIFYSFVKIDTALFDIKNAIIIVLLGFVGYGVGYIVGKTFSFTVNNKFKGVFISSVIFSNSAFMGYPFIQSIYGNQGVFYASMLQPAFQIFLWTVGISVLNSKEKMNFKKVIENPNIIALITGILFLVVRLNVSFKLPSAIESTIGSLSAMTTPLSMIIIGISTAGISLKKIVTSKEAYIASLMRLIVTPIILILIIKLIQQILLLANISPLNEVMWKSFILILSMPIASSVTAMTDIYGGDIEYASESVVISTILCIITIPIIYFIIMAI